MGVILKKDTLDGWIDEQRKAARLIVFTNGCFDILHVGHLKVLREARAQGDVLLVGVNTDGSVRRLKGAGRPFNKVAERMELLAALDPVDAVISFREDTPQNLIRQVQPDVLVKGGDYKDDDVVGGELVRHQGGRVVIVPLVPATSTTSLAERIRGKGLRSSRR